MSQARSKSNLLITILPFAFFIAMAIVFYLLLSSDRDREAVPSVLIGKPAPDLELAPVAGLTRNGSPVPGVPLNVFKDKVSVVNFWASWCAPCRAEHPLITAIAEKADVQMIGINHKDKPDNAAKFLDSLGNPYDMIGTDRNGRAAIEWGVYGMPETFIVNSDAQIVFKHVGPVSPEIYEKQILPILNQLLGE